MRGNLPSAERRVYGTPVVPPTGFDWPRSTWIAPLVSMNIDQPTSTIKAPELLSPAGDWDCIRAAVENGADAVYFGLDDGFNARARASNFDLNRIGEIMEFLHRRGVKGYVTLNTLAFSDELPRLQPSSAASHWLR
jgi:hypothetical protein